MGIVWKDFSCCHHQSQFASIALVPKIPRASFLPLSTHTLKSTNDMTSKPKPTWQTVSDYRAGRIAAALAQKANHCGCAWYEFNGRCGHRVKCQPLMCGQRRHVDEATFCNTALDRNALPRRVKVEQYRVDRICLGCRQGQHRR